MTETAAAATAEPSPSPALIPVPGWALEAFVSYVAGLDWSRTRSPELGLAWDALVAAKDGQPPAPATGTFAEPSLPAGEFARVEILGHDECTGWVTDGTRGGVPVLVIRDHDGRVMREVPGHSLHQYVPLPTPLRRPEPALDALPAGEGYPDGYFDGVPGPADDDELPEAAADGVERADGSPF